LGRAEKLRKELRKGVYAMAILAVVKAEGPIHGYGIRKRLAEAGLEPAESTLYEALKALEKAGALKSFWGEAGGRVRKYYEVTEDGEELLNSLVIEYSRVRKALEVLGIGQR